MLSAQSLHSRREQLVRLLAMYSYSLRPCLCENRLFIAPKNLLPGNSLSLRPTSPQTDDKRFAVMNTSHFINAHRKTIAATLPLRRALLANQSGESA